MWSCDLITIMVHDRSLELPTYLATFGGYAHNSDDTITTTIRAAFASAPILPYIKELAGANPEYQEVGADAAAEAILGTLKVDVRALSNGNYTVAIYCASPTASSVKWIEWKEFISSLTFMSRVNPPARARQNECCDGCHGADHATRDCPLQEIQGWNAPKPGSGRYGHPRAATTTIAQAQTHASQTHTQGWHPSDQAWMTRGGYRGRGRYSQQAPSHATRDAEHMGHRQAQRGRGRGYGRQQYNDYQYYTEYDRY